MDTSKTLKPLCYLFNKSVSIVLFSFAVHTRTLAPGIRDIVHSVQYFPPALVADMGSALSHARGRGHRLQLNTQTSHFQRVYGRTVIPNRFEGEKLFSAKRGKFLINTYLTYSRYLGKFELKKSKC